MPAQLEHANYTVSDPAATAQWMQAVFDWHIRWQGDAISGGLSVHVGTDAQYVALYKPKEKVHLGPNTHTTIGGLNHMAVVVDDLDDTEKRVLAAGFDPHNHDDYEPGRRFYFNDADNIGYEVVQYD